MTLSEAQHEFIVCVAKLIAWTDTQGWQLSFGEALRSAQEAQRLAALGKGTLNSLHCVGLAVDLNLFIDGVYQTQAPAYAPLGAYWKSLHPLARWGGDFKTGSTAGDADHFSFEWQGRQ